METVKQGARSTMVYTKIRANYFLILILPVIFCLKCKKEAEFEFCFSTMVNGTVFISTSIGNTRIPCGFLSSGGGLETNEGYDFEKEMGSCGKSASGYVMEIPDSAFLEWGFRHERYINCDDSVKHYKKRFKLPGFPPKKWNERYRIYFVIAYQDCVHCEIETVK